MSMVVVAFSVQFKKLEMSQVLTVTIPVSKFEMSHAAVNMT